MPFKSSRQKYTPVVHCTPAPGASRVNINFLYYELLIETRKFLDKIYFGSFSPQITIPTRITPRSRTLVENIFTDNVGEPSISGNLMCSISDYLAQFLIYPEQNAKTCLNEKRKYKIN